MVDLLYGSLNKKLDLWSKSGYLVMWSYFVFITNRLVAFWSWIRWRYNRGNKRKENKLLKIEKKKMLKWGNWFTKENIRQLNEKNFNWGDF